MLLPVNLGRTGRSAALVTSFVAIGVLLGALVDRVQLQNARVRELDTIQDQVGALRASLEDVVAEDIRTVEAMAAYMETHPDAAQADFATFARRVASDTTTLRNLAGAPDLTIRYVYPLAGNESIIGVSYRDLPDQLPAVLAARDLRTTIIAGPVDIVQGGRGILLRVPVFVERPGDAEFWGVVSSLMDLDSVIAQIEPAARRYGLEIAIRGSGSDEIEDDLIYGPAELFSDPTAILRSVSVPGGTWLLAAVPRELGGSRPSNERPLIVALSALLVVVSSVLAVRWTARNERLRLSEARMRDLLSSSSDLIWETDLDGRLTYIAGKTDELFGAGPADLMGEHIDSWNDASRSSTLQQQVRSSDDQEVWICDPAGGERCLLRTAVELRGPQGALVGYRGVDRDITVRKALASEVERNAGLLDLFFQQSLDGFFFMMFEEPVDPAAVAASDDELGRALQELRVSKANEAMLQQFGVAESAFLGRSAQSLFSADASADERIWRQLFATGLVHVDAEAIHPTGRTMSIEGDYILIRTADGMASGMFGIQRDVTAQRDAEAELNRYVRIIDEHVITSQTDLDGVITYASEAFARISGYRKEELIGSSHNLIRSHLTPPETFADMWQRIQRGETWHGELPNRRRDGSIYWVIADVSPLVDRHGHTYGFMSVRQDITPIKDLETVSITDRLTGLYNREKLDEVLEDERRRFDRYHEPYSLILADIDHFKQVNDRFGHQRGDAVLQRFSRLLQEQVREADTLGRWGGEEFMIICPHTDAEGAHALAENLRRSVEALSLDGDLRLTASFGVAEVREANTDELIGRADRALYDSKETGRNRTSVG